MLFVLDNSQNVEPLRYICKPFQRFFIELVYGYEPSESTSDGFFVTKNYKKALLLLRQKNATIV